MKNFDSYYDPPENPYDGYFEWLDGEADFATRADKIIDDMVELKSEMKQALIEKQNLTSAMAEDVVYEWWHDKL